MKVFIHVDDGLGIVKGRSEALEASRIVRKDLGRYGLLASEKKSAWGARQSLVWTGFLWDTRKFKFYEDSGVVVGRDFGAEICEDQIAS